MEFISHSILYKICRFLFIYMAQCREQDSIISIIINNLEDEDKDIDENKEEEDKNNNENNNKKKVCKHYNIDNNRNI